jgi:metal-dependent amidase/aminoacylase/carboxypeptidase family protein
MSVDQVMSQAVAWRRHLHAHPELSFKEHETARFIRETLATFGELEIESPTPTSVVARLRSEGRGPTLALRADIDALPIHEESGVDFASETDGVMHACGHDGHAAAIWRKGDSGLALACSLLFRRQQHDRDRSDRALLVTGVPPVGLRH